LGEFFSPPYDLKALRGRAPTARMPRRRNNDEARKIAEAVGQIINNCDAIVPFIVDGLFSFMADRTYTHDYNRLTTPLAFRDKSGVICALRLLNKEVKYEVDERIIAWMNKLRSLIITVKKKEIEHDQAKVERIRAASGLPSPDDAGVHDARCAAAATKLQDEHAILAKHAASCFSKDLTECITHCMKPNSPRPGALESTFKPVDLTKLDFSLSTFMCMATGRCQIHGPVGGSPCRNCCTSPPYPSCDNFTTLTFGNTKCTVYAREKCVDAVCLKPDARFLSHGNDRNLLVNTARAMFRMGNVQHPFSPRDLIDATNYWGCGTDGDFLYVPNKVMVFRHPVISKICPNASIQELLDLTDRDAQICHNDAVRKNQQRIDRDAEMKKKHIKELCDDVDYYMASTCRGSIPVSSLKELGQICSGMEASIRAGVVHNASLSGASCKQHCMDIEIVRNGLRTVELFLGPVIYTDRKMSKDSSVCSAEAYDYISGMHVGHYGKVNPEWALEYANLDGFKAVLVNCNAASHPARAVCKAMSFFDELDKDSLLCCESRSDDLLPKRWLLSTKQMRIVFDARWETRQIWGADVGYKNLTKMDADFRYLISRQGSDIELPPLFTKLTHTNGVLTTCCKKASERVREWYMNTFRLLVKDPSTRGAALDLLGIRPMDLVSRAMEVHDDSGNTSSHCPIHRKGPPGKRVAWVPDAASDESDYDWGHA